MSGVVRLAEEGIAATAQGSKATHAESPVGGVARLFVLDLSGNPRFSKVQQLEAYVPAE